MFDSAYTIEVDVRFRDLDVMGQVHNAVILTYVEEARTGYFSEVIGVDLTDTAGALVHQEIDYERPIEGGETVTVATHVSDIGGASLTMPFEIRTADGTAATGEIVHVVLDPETKTPSSVPEEWRKRIESFE